MRISEGLKAGHVYVNNYFSLNPVIPFGGFKDSGIGREHGEDALKSYTEESQIIY